MQSSCGTCSKALGAEYVNIADDQKYHPECFLCCICTKKLAGKLYFEVENKLYCEDDYHPRFSPACTHCDQIIKDDYVEIDGQNYHSSCFICQGCQRPFKSTYLIVFSTILTL